MNTGSFYFYNCSTFKFNCVPFLSLLFSSTLFLVYLNVSQLLIVFAATVMRIFLADLMVFRLGAHRRSEVEIICDILETCLDGTAKTSVVYRTNLNFTRLNKYVNMLLGMRYISLSVVCGGGNGSEMKIVYSTTEQGKSFLANFVNMQKLSRRNEASARPLISRFR